MSLSREYYTFTHISEAYEEDAGYAKAYAGVKSDTPKYGDSTLNPNFAIRV